MTFYYTITFVYGSAQPLLLTEGDLDKDTHLTLQSTDVSDGAMTTAARSQWCNNVSHLLMSTVTFHTDMTMSYQPVVFLLC